MCGGGPSTQQEQIANQEQNFSSMLNADFASRYAEQSGALNSLTGIIQNIQNGKFAPGFGADTLAGLNTAAIDTAGAQYRNAAQSVAGGLSGLTSSSGLESGVEQQIKAGLASQAAGNAANSLINIKLANAQQGINNTNTILGGYSGLAGLTSPNALGGLENTASSNAFGSATEIHKEQQAGQNALIGGITGLIGSASDFIPGVGPMLSSGLQGAAGGLTGADAGAPAEASTY